MKNKFTKADIKYIIRQSELSADAPIGDGRDYLGEAQERFNRRDTSLGDKMFIIWQMAGEAYWDSGRVSGTRVSGTKDDEILISAKEMGWVED